MFVEVEIFFIKFICPTPNRALFAPPPLAPLSELILGPPTGGDGDTADPVPGRRVRGQGRWRRRPRLRHRPGAGAGRGGPPYPHREVCAQHPLSTSIDI